jgi:hypothetical protein
MSHFQSSKPDVARGRRLVNALLSPKGILGLALALLLALASGVWASPQQVAPRQTVPTRTPIPPITPTEVPQPTATSTPTRTPTPRDTPAPAMPTDTPVPATPSATETAGVSPDDIPPDDVPPESTDTPQPTNGAEQATGDSAPTRPLRVEVADIDDGILYVLLQDKETLARFVPPTPTPSPTPTPLPAHLPPELIGKIAFQSNYFGRTRLFLVDPDGENLALLVASWVYDVALARDRLSPDGRYYVKQGQGNNGIDLFVGPVDGGEAKRLTFVGQGKAWDWAWAPDGRHIAFTSNQEGDDDIFAVHIWTPEDPLPKTTKLTTDGSWESDKHPSYSPDGSQIVFHSNRSGRDQLWIMDADGANPRQLLALDGNCWNPVWLK